MRRFRQLGSSGLNSCQTHRKLNKRKKSDDLMEDTEDQAMTVDNMAPLNINHRVIVHTKKWSG